MADINFNKEVFNKVAYKKTINTEFTQLGVQTIQEQIDEQPTIQEFFNMYNTLFYQINELGETNSHEYLIKTSSQYINFGENDELIEALQNEIAQLRVELLETQQQSSENTTTPIESQISNNLQNNTTSVSSGTGGGSGGSGGSGGGGY